MRTRFVVAFPDPLPPEKERALHEFIKGHGLLWWHPIPGLWLLIDPTGVLTSIELRNQLEWRDDLKLQCLVLGVDGGQAAWFGPPSQFEWMTKYWPTGENDAQPPHDEAPVEPKAEHSTLRDRFKGP